MADPQIPEIRITEKRRPLPEHDVGEITATVNGKEVRGWSYKTRDEQRQKMQMAHEFAEGWFQATERAAKIAEFYDGAGTTSHGYDDQLGDAGKTKRDIATDIRLNKEAQP